MEAIPTPKTLYLDCSSGISGDMTVAALLDLGADEQALRDALASLPLDGYEIRISRVKKSGIDACDFDVVLDEAHENHDHDMAYLHGFGHAFEAEHGHEHAHAPGSVDADEEHGHGHMDADEEHAHEHNHEHGHESGHRHDHKHEHGHGHDHGHEHHGRNLDDIRGILYSGSLNDRALAIALHIFEILAEAEAKVHGRAIDEVHFHEVGAVDSIIDIAAIAFCIDNLNIERVIIPSLSEGTGLVRCQHGLLPIPVPATSAILQASGLPLRILPIEGELVTPTGAAVAAALCTDRALPERFTIDRIGIGAGKRAYAVSGILRAMLITEGPNAENILNLSTTAGFENLPSQSGNASSQADTVLQIDANIDDSTGEALGFVMEELQKAGALDVFFTPIIMKKNRPACLLSLLCPPTRRREMETLIFRHTTCIGVRCFLTDRTKCEREIASFETPLGTAEVKICCFGNEIYYYPEHESVAALSRATGLGYKEVYHLVKSFAMREDLAQER